MTNNHNRKMAADRSLVLNPLNLKPERIQIFLLWIPEWTYEGDGDGFAPGTDAVVRNYNLKDPPPAVDFASKVFEVAKRHSHFPELDVVGNEVRIRLTTPEVGLTEMDFEMAVLFDHVYLTV